MTDPLEDLLRECTVEVGDGPNTYTGFFVAPRTVLTELSRKANLSDLVVRMRDDDQLIRVVRLDSPLSPHIEVNADQDTLFDYRLISALLIDDFGYHPSVDIDTALPYKGDPVLIAGYREVMRVTFSHVTNVVAPHGLECLGLPSDAIAPNMRGAALLNLRTGRIWGMLVANNPAMRATDISVMPFTEMAGTFSELVSTSQKFHARDGRWALAVEHQEAAMQEDDDQENLLFRIYVPSGRLYAAEANRLLSLFREWLIATRGPGVRQAGYRTAAGAMYEFYTDGDGAASDLHEQFGAFSSFLAVCTTDPAVAADMLAGTAIGREASVELVARFGRDVRRLQLDLQYERERRILTIRHNLEEELVDCGVDLRQIPISQFTAVIESLVPGPAARESLALLAASPIGRTGPPVTVHINQQIITALESAIVQNVQGTVHFGSQAKELLALIERVGGEDAAVLESAVHELEDADARPADRSAAKRRLQKFLRQLGHAARDVSIDLLERYLESKIL